MFQVEEQASYFWNADGLKSKLDWTYNCGSMSVSLSFVPVTAKISHMSRKNGFEDIDVYFDCKDMKCRLCTGGNIYFQFCQHCMEQKDSDVDYKVVNVTVSVSVYRDNLVCKKVVKPCVPFGHGGNVTLHFAYQRVIPCTQWLRICFSLRHVRVHATTCYAFGLGPIYSICADR